ncbi:MAG: glycosyltransferase [Armatimonadetes bacterium]|nr:glycosyltransferase [Armatimonadota bacterium]
MRGHPGSDSFILWLSPKAAANPNIVRIALLTSWNERCGIAAYSRGLVEALQPRVEVRVVPASFRRGPPALYETMAAALNEGDVAHVQHSYAFFGGMHPLRTRYPSFIRGVRRPLVLTVHELDEGTGPLAIYKRWFNRRTLLAGPVRAWVVHSPSLRAALIALGAPADRIHLHPMPVPEPLPLPDGDASRRRLDLVGRTVLTIPGFLARRKGYDLALAALARLPKRYLLLVAGGPHAADRTRTEDWLRAEARRHGVEDRFRITGFLSDERLSEVLVATDVVLAPFHSMSASASLHLALGYRKAIVASDLPPNRALDCVALFPVGDADALAQAIRAVVENTDRRRELEQAADAFARHHGYAALAERTLALYDAVLAEERGQG